MLLAPKRDTAADVTISLAQPSSIGVSGILLIGSEEWGGGNHCFVSKAGDDST